LRGFHQDYADKGFTLIGVHSPEFNYEKDPAAVERAIREHRIEYPVAMDNDMAVWGAYRNRYWPARYLIDKRGIIRYTHIGEGAYEQTRRAIELLLREG
jgi:hypothetical protein